MDAFRQVSFTALLRRALRLTASPSGRSSRAELAVAFIAALFFVPLGTLALMLAGASSGPWPVLGLNLVSALPFPALLVRRLHDQNRTGWWAGLALFGYGLWLTRALVAGAQGIDARIALDRLIWPLDWLAIAANLAIVTMLVLPGTRGPNRFGPDPRVEFPD